MPRSPLIAALSSMALLPMANGAGLRPLSTDRPDTTESPYTVDAGHLQLECEIAAYTFDGDERELSVGEWNVKIGLDASTDLQLVLPLFTRIQGGPEGFGDVVLRLKRNLWGNDEGSTAFAVMPFLKIPTANGDLGNDQYEGGLILPLAFDAPAGWSCAVMAEFDVNADEEGDGYHLGTLVSFTSSHDLTENAAAFFELVGIAGSSDSSTHEAYFNTGLTWLATPSWQLDGGLRIGLTPDSADFTPFLGASTKF